MAHAVSLRWMWYFFFALILAIVLDPVPSHAKPDPDGSVFFDVPSLPLPAALIAFSRQARIQVLTGGSLPKDARSQSVKGRMTPHLALSRLLQGTGLMFSFTDELTVAIKPLAAASPTGATPTAAAMQKPSGSPVPHTLEEVHATSVLADPPATRADLPLRRIPQSVSILDRDEMAEQNLTRLEDTLDYATGIMLLRNSFLDTEFYSRGFPITSYHVDGSPPLSWRKYGMESTNPDLAEYDRIEVLRGVDALFGGLGNPSASITLWRKRALADATDSAELTFDERGRWRGEVDATAPLSYDGTLRGRVVAAQDDRPEFYGPASSKGTLLFTTIEYEASPTTVIDAGVSYQLRRTIPMFGGLPLNIDGSDSHLPRSTFLGVPWNRNDAQNGELFAQVDHQLDEHWKLKFDLTHFDQTGQDLGIEFDGALNPVTHNFEDGSYWVTFSQRSRLRQTVAGLLLSGEFDWRNRTINVLLGTDYQHELTDLDEYTSSFYGSIPFPIDPSIYLPPNGQQSTRSQMPDQQLTQRGLYAALRLEPSSDGLSLTAGARWNWYAEKGITYVDGDYEISDYKEAPHTQLFLGSVYDLSHNLSVYASYAEIFGPQGGALFYGHGLIGPSRGANTEAGIKGSWAQGAINASLGVFDTSQRNVALYLFPGWIVNEPGVCCYEPGSEKSAGIEAELNGRISDHWNLRIGYALQDSYYDHEAVDTGRQGTPLESRLPRQRFHAWVTYLPGGRYAPWSFSLGVRMQSGVVQEGDVCDREDTCDNLIPYRITQGSYTVTDLRIGYQFGRSWTAALTLTNLFDRRYYQTISAPDFGNWYGEPRNISLTIRKTLD
jgi:outer membrane receptor for ferric coprogen and ferric-rhodotorulic acid